MFKTAAITGVFTLSLSMGCLPQGPEALEGALPTADTVRVDVPADGQSLKQLNALGDVAEFYVLTRGLSETLNGGAGWVLVLVHAIVQYPPTTVEGNVYTWGPHSEALDPAEWRLVVTENADGSYDWTLDARSKIEDQPEFLAILSGHAVPGAEDHRGVGRFTIDFDAAERVDPFGNEDRGVLDVAYDLDSDPIALDMNFSDVIVDDAGAEIPVAFQYGYVENRDGSGALAFDMRGDIDENGSAVEDLLIQSQWLADGQGRSDVEISGGDLEATTVVASECWNGQFRRVHYTDSAGLAPTEGEAAACAIAP